jgi:hypothetical protein
MNRAEAGGPAAARRRGLPSGEAGTGTLRWWRMLGEGGRAHCRRRFSEAQEVANNGPVIELISSGEATGMGVGMRAVAGRDDAGGKKRDDSEMFEDNSTVETTSTD